jgi:putative FmdB family regulatory protein
MPFYEYTPDDATTPCDECARGFEVLQSISEPALTECPYCGAACHRVISSFACHAGSKHVLAKGNLERNGFTQYQKVSPGVYEKTAGVGPKIIQKGEKPGG